MSRAGAMKPDQIVLDRVSQRFPRLGAAYRTLKDMAVARDRSGNLSSKRGLSIGDE